MSRWAVASIVVCALAGGSVQAADVGANVVEALRERPRVRVIVALREPTTSVANLSLRNEEVHGVQGRVLDRLQPSDFILTHRWASLNAFAGEVTLPGLRTLMADPDVLMVDEDPIAYMDLAETAALIRVDQVRGAGTTGRGVVVAVLDTGADTHHPDIRDGLVAEQCFCTSASGSGCCPNGTAEQSGAGAAEDDNGHGTNVTGIITSDGRVAPPGIAPDAMVVAIKVLDKTGAGTSAGILSGLDFVINKHPEVKVVNLSLGLGNLFPGVCDSAASFTTAFASAVNTLRGRGAVFFASSGNNGSSSQIAVPACIGNAIAVGAVYKGDVGTITFGCTDATTAADRVACFSNSDSQVDVLAPGAPVTSAGIGGGVSTFVGTSQACPVAAGVAALILSAHPGLSPDAVEAAMKNTGVTITDPKNGLAFRRIDAKAAVDSVR
jgi:subtilisin family serine protease